nr:protein shisa-4-like isoform X1 [Paramormyrops kingsleyae]
MSGRRFVVLTLCAALLFVAVADNCESYTDVFNVRHSFRRCLESEFCCGQCSNRYCCSIKAFKLDDDAQEKCPLRREKRATSGMMIAEIIPCVMFSLFFTLCFCMMCPRCWLYKKCRSPMFTGYVTELPPSQAQQRGADPGYQQVARVQLIPTASYQAQPYPPAGPPPSYQEIMRGTPGIRAGPRSLRTSEEDVVHCQLSGRISFRERTHLPRHPIPKPGTAWGSWRTLSSLQPLPTTLLCLPSRWTTAPHNLPTTPHNLPTTQLSWTLPGRVTEGITSTLFHVCPGFDFGSISGRITKWQSTTRNVPGRGSTLE